MIHNDVIFYLIQRATVLVARNKLGIGKTSVSSLQSTYAYRYLPMNYDVGVPTVQVATGRYSSVVYARTLPFTVEERGSKYSQYVERLHVERRIGLMRNQ